MLQNNTANASVEVPTNPFELAVALAGKDPDILQHCATQVRCSACIAHRYCTL